MSLNDDLIKHQIFIQRFAGTEYKNIKEQLNILRDIAKLEALNASSGSRLKNTLRNTMRNFSSIGVSNMEDFAEYEANFSSKLFKKYFKEDIKTPTKEILSKKLSNTNMEINNIGRKGTRKSLATAYKQFGRKKADELTQIIRDGQAQNLSIAEIHKMIDEKVNNLHNVQARVLANTNVNYTATIAKNTTIEINKDIIKKVVWVSILDSGTTDYCASHDGNIYPVGEGPRPPAHWGCRSYISPHV